MERYNIKNVEKKWQDIWSKKKTYAAVLNNKKKSYIALKCFLTPRARSTWATFEITQSEMF